MSDRACHFYAEQAGNTEQKPKKAGDEAPPNEKVHVPLGMGTQFQELGRLSAKQHKWGKEDSGTCICPISELDSRVVAIRERRLDQD